MRKATLADLDFLMKTDLEDEGITSTSPKNLSVEELSSHREKMAVYITGADDVAWIYEDRITCEPVGTIMYRFRDRLHEKRTEANEFLFRYIEDDTWLPPDGRFCEVFNLWVAPSYRRRGLATKLKRYMEADARSRNVKVIYTHTEERNEQVLVMNRKLGYQEIRRGPIWDSVIRVSLVKVLD